MNCHTDGPQKSLLTVLQSIVLICIIFQVPTRLIGQDWMACICNCYVDLSISMFDLDAFFIKYLLAQITQSSMLVKDRHLLHILHFFFTNSLTWTFVWCMVDGVKVEWAHLNGQPCWCNSAIPPTQPPSTLVCNGRFPLPVMHTGSPTDSAFFVPPHRASGL